MNRSIRQQLLPLAVAIASLPSMALAFDSGSTGVDGAFTPTVNTQLQLPPDGIFNFTNVNIPSGVTVTFAKNATNTPVTILASGNVTINGTVDVSGSNSPGVGTAGNGNPGDDGLPGIGGPGGFDGGAGGDVNGNRGAMTGLGPGAGRGGAGSTSTSFNCGGGGANYGDSSATNARAFFTTTNCRFNANDNSSGTEGAAYGSATLLPLIGGSGGGGGGAGDVFSGSGGGGGGGAILIAASGTVTISGTIRANGGTPGSSAGPTEKAAGATGGGGSGGAIRIIATALAGNGTIQANRGGEPSVNGSRFVSSNGGIGGFGRIRLEADTITFSSNTVPTFSFAAPQDVFVPGLPSLRITSVAGLAAPAAPTGSADIILPADTPNPVTVQFASSGVPLGNTVQLTVTPSGALPVSVLSNALSGDIANASASASIELPQGPSTLSAQVSFTVTASLGDEMSRFAQGERVERVVLAAAADGSSETLLITVSGKEYRYNGPLPAFTSQAS